MIVPVPMPEPKMEAFVGFERTTVNVSFVSTVVSPLTSTFTVLLV